MTVRDRSYILILLGLFSLVSCGNKDDLLRLNLEIGATYRHDIATQSIITQNFLGNEVTTENNLLTNLSYRVNNYKDDLYHMTVTYDSLSLTMKNQEVFISAHSGGSNSELDDVLSGIQGKSFNLIMSDHGFVEELKAPDDLLNHIDALDMDSVVKKQIRYQMSKAYGASTLADNLNVVFRVYPDDIRFRESEYTLHTNTGGLMPLDAEIDYKVEKDKKGRKILRAEARYATDVTNNTTETDGMQISYNLNGSMDGNYTLAKNGWVTDAVIKQNISGMMDFKGNALVPEGMEVPMDIKVGYYITSY